MRKVIIIGAALAMISGLSACDDSSQSNSGASQTAPTSSSTSVVVVRQTAPLLVWPGAGTKDTVFDTNTLRKNFMVVYDGSGSMGNDACGGNGSRSRHDDGMAALKAFANAVPADANLGLLVFDNRGMNMRVPLGTGNRAAFQSAVDSIRIGGGTPLRSAIEVGFVALSKQGQSQFGYGRFTLVIVTDGAANQGEDPTRIVNFVVDNTPVEVNTIGLCLSGRHSLNQPGRTSYAAAGNLKELIDGLKDVLAEASEADATFEGN